MAIGVVLNNKYLAVRGFACQAWRAAETLKGKPINSFLQTTPNSKLGKGAQFCRRTGRDTTSESTHCEKRSFWLFIMDDNQGGMEPSPSSVSGRSRTSSVPPRRSRSRPTSEQQQALALVRSHSSPTNNLKNRVRNLFRASAAAHMHSVGVLGKNETLAPTGSLQTTTTTTKPSGEEDEEDSIFIQQQVVEGGSLSAAVFGIIKGTVGPAILYLPRGFRQSGYAVAIPSMLFATQMYIYNAYRLLECWKVESQRNREMAEHMKETISYLNMNEDDHTTVPDYTPVLLTYGELARRGLGPYSCLVKLGISLFQFGVVVSYCIFVPENLQECFETLTGATLPKTLFLALMLLIEIPMSWMVDIRKLTPCNVVATVLIAFGLVSVLTMALVSGLSVSEDNDESIAFVENTKTFPAFTDVWFLFVGTSFFMMEGSMTLVVPLQEAVALPKDRRYFIQNGRALCAIVSFFLTLFAMLYSIR